MLLGPKPTCRDDMPGVTCHRWPRANMMARLLGCVVPASHRGDASRWYADVLKLVVRAGGDGALERLIGHSVHLAFGVTDASGVHIVRAEAAHPPATAAAVVASIVPTVAVSNIASALRYATRRGGSVGA